jgi:MFS family permease
MSNSEGAIPWPGVGVLFTAAIVLLLVFWRHQGRTANPIIDSRVLRDKPFIAANIYNFLYGMGVLGVFSFIPLYAISVYETTILESGLIITPKSIGMIIASLVTSIYLVRWGYRRPMLLGTAAVSLVLILLAFESPGFGLFGWRLSGIVVLSMIMLLSGLSVGAIAPAANNACIELMPDRVGTITGVRGMFRQVGSAISISITALILNNMGDMNRGFRVIFVGFAAVLLLSIPIIFLVPKSANSTGRT